jgi:hypothetical protein
MFYILAGADIKEMEGQNFSDVWYNNFLGEWSSVQECKKPIIAAVNGYAVSIQNLKVLSHVIPIISDRHNFFHMLYLTLAAIM